MNFQLLLRFAADLHPAFKKTSLPSSQWLRLSGPSPKKFSTTPAIVFLFAWQVGLFFWQ